MRNITMTMNAVSCVLSVRPRPAGQILLADTHAQGQGTTVSFVALTGLRTAGVDAPIFGDFSVVRPTYKTTDVACFRSWRPPV